MGVFCLRRSIVVDAWNTPGHSQGIFARNVDSLIIEECLFDHNGWNESIPGADATIYNRNMYIKDCPNAITRGNVDARGASGGIQQRVGGISEYNLSLMNPLGITFGHAENHPDMPASGSIRFNVILDARDIDDLPRGIGISAGDYVDSVDIHDNIVAHNAHGTGTVRGIKIGSDNPSRFARNISVHDNIVYSWYESGNGSWGQSGPAIQVARESENASVMHNLLQQVSPGGELVSISSAFRSDWHFEGNTYTSANQADKQFSTDSGRVSYSSWISISHESDSSYSQVAFPDPNRDIATYMQSLGLTASLDAFLARAREQRRGSWSDEYTAVAVIDYIREGFGLAAVAP